MRRKVKAVLFDLDGVLLDSIRAWHHTYNDILRHFGAKPISEKEFKKIFGNTIEYNVKKVLKISKKEAYRLSIKYFNQNKNYVKVFPETKKVLEKLSKSGIKTGLITNTPRKILSLTLKHYKLKKYFDSIVPVEAVKKGKPAPDMALKACRLLNVKPKNTILIGDTKNDMVAGKRAGCVTVGYGVKGNYRIDNLKEIEKFIYAN